MNDTVATVEELRAWVAAAGQRDRLTYYRGAMLPRFSQVGRAARELAEADLVLTLQRRIAPDLTEFFVQRTARAMKRTRPLADGDGAALTSTERLVLIEIEAAAARGGRCPSNPGLAANSGLGLSEVIAALGGLRRKSVCSIETWRNERLQAWRVVHLASGASTQPVPDRAGWLRVDEAYEGAMPGGGRG